jgi:hypothetical protein
MAVCELNCATAQNSLLFSLCLVSYSLSFIFLLLPLSLYSHSFPTHLVICFSLFLLSLLSLFSHPYLFLITVFPALCSLFYFVLSSLSFIYHPRSLFLFHFFIYFSPFTSLFIVVSFHHSLFFYFFVLFVCFFPHVYAKYCSLVPM